MVAAASGRVVSNGWTGLAIHGFDPVAYFTDARPEAGYPEFEQVVAGTAWRFRNEGNRAAFAAHPDVYLPRYGGHDPVALARGLATAGNPLVWLVVEDRLYLFYGVENRQAFAADPQGAIAAAEAHWPRVSATLEP
jgi:hypothetical protein